jgi:hypothetical protein
MRHHFLPVALSLHLRGPSMPTLAEILRGPTPDEDAAAILGVVFGRRELCALGFMKKARAKNRRSIAKASRKRCLRGLASKAVAANRRFLNSASGNQRRCQKKQWQRFRRSLFTFVPLPAPEIFGLFQAASRSKLLAFLHNLKKLTLQNRQRVHVDFRNTSRMHPEGTLLFAAELDEILRSSRGRVLVRCNRPRDEVVAQVLQHLGLFSKMGLRANAPITSEKVMYWRVSSGQQVVGQLVAPVVDYYKDHSSSIESRKLYDGLIEAMTNSRQHAYTQPRRDSSAAENENTPPTEGRWWMFSQLKDGALSVSFCDLGIGIKRSLLEGKAWPTAVVEAMVSSLGLGWKDSAYIKAAFELGTSRTNAEHRGKGLRDLKTVVEGGGGWLLVLSNRGFYRCSDNGKSERTGDFVDSIYGTVISWQVPVADKADKT